jgi:GTP-binding protein HflX
MIRGNLEGVRKLYINELEDLYNFDCDKNVLISEELLDVMCRISEAINKEISIYINRRGKIVDVAIGDNTTVSLVDLTEKRSEMGLNGIRCIHTHPGGQSTLSSVDITALLNLKFDVMAAVSINNGVCDEISFAYIDIENGKLLNKVFLEGPYTYDTIKNIDIINTIEGIETQIFDYHHDLSDDIKERVLLVGGVDNNDAYSTEESLDELEELVETAGAEVIERIIQKKSKIDSAFYIGSGKVTEISLIKQSLNIGTVIFDDELTGAQVRNLEDAIGCKIIDRTTLILDIFAQRAISREGKIQVELAQLRYAIPRLLGMGRTLSRTGGGIGTRGPGEKKLEVDRRLIRGRINDLQKELDNIKKTRSTQRERRISKEMPVVSLAGYTNAGKSTLRNTICELYGIEKEKVFEANMLFATLDTTTRLASLPSGKEALFSDTVGFIRKLPHDLIEAFKSTLEELTFSSLILHVVDASNENAIVQIDTVNKVLDEIGAGDREILLVLNKTDIATEENLNILRSKYSGALEISAKRAIKIDELLKLIEEKIYKNFVDEALLIPYSEGRLVSYLHENHCVEKEEYREDGIYVEVRTTQDIFGRVREFSINNH